MNVTLQQVAKHAGVAIDTARKVINGNPTVRPYLKKLVDKSVKELDYHPNLMARSLRDRSLTFIPISVNQISEFYFGDLAWHLSRSVVGLGMEPTLCFDAEHLLRMCRSFPAKGCILVTHCTPENLRELKSRQKVVAIEDIRFVTKGIGGVAIDFGGVYRGLTKILLARGRCKIAVVSDHYINCMEKPGWGPKKFPDVKQVLHEAGLALVGCVRHGVFGSAEEFGAWLDEHPGTVDAVLCENDLKAAKVVAEMAARGVRTPDDILVVGCDDNWRVKGTWSVRIDVSYIADVATGLLAKMMEGGRNKTLIYTPEIVGVDGRVIPVPTA